MKFLIIRLSSLGDIVLCQSTVALLREEYPTAGIDFLTKKTFVGLVEAFGCVDKIYRYPDDKAALINQAYDCVIDLHNKPRTWLIRAKIKAHKIYTYPKKRFLRELIIRQLSKGSIDSIVYLYAQAIQKLTDKSVTYPKLYTNPVIEKHIDETILNYGINPQKFLIGVFPAATHNTKMYPVEKLAEFIQMIPKAWNCQFLVMGNYNEKDVCASLARKSKAIDLSGVTNIPSLISFINRLDCVISNDSGPMHIAAALGKPQIAIYGATDPRLGFRPLNVNAVCIESSLKCKPCSLHGASECPKGNFLCMQKISSSRIYKAFQQIFEEKILIKQ